MSLESLYADRIEDGIQRQLRSPGPAPAPESFSAWSVLSSGVKGIPSAAAEAAGSFVDLVGAIEASGQRAIEREHAAHPERFNADQLGRMQRSKEAQQRLEQAGPALRRKADEFAPSPETAHAADKVVHGLTRGVSKAVADVMLFGPVGGAAVFGADEGNTAAQRLIEQGVDTATAAKVGATTGVVQGLGVAIPGVGPTIAKTVGLALATGPASFMAQEKLTKDILQNANYGDLAAQHDPFDPLGLTLSAVLPGVIGGMRIRTLMKAPTTVEDVVKHIESGGRRYGKDGQLLTSPKGAQGEMQVMPGTATDPGFGVAPAKDNSPDELARVGREYLVAMQQRYGNTDQALAAYNAGPGRVDDAIKKGGDKWLDLMPDETKAYVAKANKLLDQATATKGASDPAVVDAARVRVLDGVMARSLPDHPSAAAWVMRAADDVGAGRLPEVPPAVTVLTASVEERSILRGELSAVEARVAELAPTAADLAEPGAVRQARTQLAEMEQERPVYGPQDVQARTKEIQAADGVSYKAARAEAAKQIAEEVGDFQRRQQRLNDFIERNAKAQQAVEAIGAANKQADEIRRRLEESITTLGPLERTPVQQAVQDAISQPARTLDAPVAAGSLWEVSQRAKEPENALPNTLPPVDSVARVESAAKSDDTGVDPARLKQLLDERPDMKVKLPGSEETLSVEAALLRAHEVYDDEVSIADLVKVAAECALSNGA